MIEWVVQWIDENGQPVGEYSIFKETIEIALTTVANRIRQSFIKVPKGCHGFYIQEKSVWKADFLKIHGIQ